MSAAAEEVAAEREAAAELREVSDGDQKRRHDGPALLQGGGRGGGHARRGPTQGVSGPCVNSITHSNII